VNEKKRMTTDEGEKQEEEKVINLYFISIFDCIEM